MVFKKSKETYDLDTMCNCIIRCFQIIQDELEGDETRADENIEYIMLNIDTLIYNSMRAINKKDEKSAYFYFYSNLKYSDKPLREHLFVKYLNGKQASGIMSSLESKYVVPKDAFKKTYSGLLNGLLQI